MGLQPGFFGRQGNVLHNGGPALQIG